MKLVVIDGQSGRTGALLVERIRAAGLPLELLAVGTNAIATAAMMKAGAQRGATGENPVLVACRDADIIAGYFFYLCYYFPTKQISFSGGKSFMP